MDLQEAETKDAEPEDAAIPAQVATDADATEADVSDLADLDQEEQEKQPMTGGERAADAPSAGGEPTPTAAAEAEKNGSVKLKMPDETEGTKFTGLSKEQLLRVAGTPG